MITPSDVINVACAIKDQVERYQSNNTLAVEIKNRCISLLSIIKRPRKGEVTPEIGAILESLFSVLNECQALLAKFAESAKFIRLLFAKSYQSEFTSVHGRLLRLVNDLQLVWISDIQDRLVDVQEMVAQASEIEKSIISKFEYEAFDLISGMQNHLEAVMDLNHSEQMQLFSNMKGIVSDNLSKILHELTLLRGRKDSGEEGYLRLAPVKLKKAMDADQLAHEKIDPSHISINWNDSLGEGSFGQVFSAQLMGVGDVAVKLIPREVATEFFREVSFLSCVAISREVLRIHGWSEVTQPSSSKRFVVAITDLCRCSMAAVISDLSQDPSLSTWLEWLQQVASGMAYLARMGIYHRDLKPENLLLGFENRVVISDFGLAVTRSTVQRNNSSFMMIGGTAGYIAPESYEGVISEASDVYSFGIVAAHMLYRCYPWVDDRNRPLNATQIAVLCKTTLPRKFPILEDFPQLPPECVILLRSCCEIESALRPHFLSLKFSLFKAVSYLKDPIGYKAKLITSSSSIMAESSSDITGTTSSPSSPFSSLSAAMKDNSSNNPVVPLPPPPPPTPPVPTREEIIQRLLVASPVATAARITTYEQLFQRIYNLLKQGSFGSSRLDAEGEDLIALDNDILRELGLVTNIWSCIRNINKHSPVSKELARRYSYRRTTEFRGHRSEVLAAAVMPDNLRLITGSAGDISKTIAGSLNRGGSIKVWSIATRECLITIKSPFSVHSLFPLNDWIVFASTSDYHSSKSALLKIDLRLATSTSITARFVGQPAIVTRWNDAEIRPQFFLADGKTVLCLGGGNGDLFSLWDFSLDEGNDVSSLQRCKVKSKRPVAGASYHCRSFYPADMTDSGGVVKQVLVTGGNYTSPAICIWDLQELKLIKSLFGNRSGVSSIVCPTPDRLVSVETGRFSDEFLGDHIRLWDMISGDCLRILTEIKYLESLFVLPANKDVIPLACNYDTLYFWSWTNNEVLHSVGYGKKRVFGVLGDGSLLKYGSAYNILEMLG